MNRFFKSLGAAALRKIGLARYHPSLISLASSLERTTNYHLGLNTLIDIGASNGCWAKAARATYPEIFCYLVEANRYHQEDLELLKKTDSNLDYALAAASDSVGQVYFDDSDPFSGLASHNNSGSTTTAVPAITIDYICEKEQLKPPYLIKLDTHGFEVPIFEGAEETLKQTALIVVEVYNFDIAPGSLRFPKMCQYLEEKGFRCIDMCDPLFRKKDGALWQFDLFFLPKSHPVFQDNRWG